MLDAQINTLILVGGRSTRMKTDKAHLSYGTPQPIYKKLVEKFSPFSNEVMLSSSIDLVSSFDLNIPILVDEFTSVGPMGALATYFKHFNKPVFVVACDMPFIEKEWLKLVFEAYDAKFDVIIAQSNEDIQPLFAIYNPSCSKEIEIAISNSNYKLYTLLKKLHYKEVRLQGEASLLNINTKSEYIKLMDELASEK